MRAPLWPTARARRPGDRQRRGDAAREPGRPPLATGAPIEVRLAGRRSLAADDVHVLAPSSSAPATPHPHRGPPAAAAAARRRCAGARPARARCCASLDHPRLDRAALRRHRRRDPGRHRPPWPAGAVRARRRAARALGRVDARSPAPPVAFEPPSAGFVLDWQLLDRLRQRGIGFATLTHAAGLSSTGDAALDARLPFDEPYRSARRRPSPRSAATRRAAIASSPSARRSRARSSTPPRTGRPSRRRRHRRPPARPPDAARASSTRSSAAPTSPAQPPRVAARVRRRRRRSTRIDAALESARLPHPRVRRLGAASSAHAPRSRYAEARSNLKTATLARRLGQRRTALPA